MHDAERDANTETYCSAFVRHCPGVRWRPGLAFSFSSAIVVAAAMPVIENFGPPAVGLTMMAISLMA